MARTRRRRVEEPENHERWLVSYADFITLLFAFFVVMYAVSSVNEGKYRVLSDALTAAFRTPTHSLSPIQLGDQARSLEGADYPVQGEPALIVLPLPTAPAPQTQSDTVPIEAAPEADAALPEPTVLEQDPNLAQLADKISAAMGSLIRDDLISIRRDERWLEVEIKSSILYPSGSARLEPAAIPILEQLATLLAPFPNPVHVEGFTDNVPIHTAAFLSNWELSAARAASVVHLFSDYGIAPQRMAAIGYGEFKPVASNDSVEGRAKNRRVVLVIMPGVDARWSRSPASLVAP